MDNKESKNIDRREFLKKVGTGAVAASAVAFTACAGTGSKRGKNGDTGKSGTEGEGGGTNSSPAGGGAEAAMTYRTTPTTGDKVSLLGYGCMRWPEKTVGGQRELDQDGVNRLVDYAIDHGVNYFDTAPMYNAGASETVTGIALSRHPRDKYYIATKMSNQRDAERRTCLNMYNNSFKQLQVDYIDYYLMHAVGGGGMPALMKRFYDNGILDFLLEEREKGKIRNLGFSFHGDTEVFDYLLSRHDEYKWDFVQIQMNYMDWKHGKEVNPRGTEAEYLYTELHKRGIPAVIMEPLLGGRLSNVPEHIATKLLQRAPEKSVASWAFRFCGSFPGVLTALSGMTYMEHLQDNIGTFSPLVPLTEEEFDFLEETAKLMLQYPTIPCNDCNYCMPCPYGIDIPGVLTHYNKCVNEGNVPASSQDPFYRKERRAFLVGYDRSVPKLRQADHCINCRECVPKCPQNIDIPRQMNRINDFVETLKQGREF